ncbi:hypothetical protein AF332_05005 [Sporosarcina globispora]|uniref:Uncharacterized protein n=1 Tax=Sporosarcina globispora TaxID=1459 RepID=A0A0M0G9Y1_SPOGL|nr:hypothetical protein [Sporosarcina globispora]KON86246.1 hypothetical protein AF332_05005 [Sporosarcina globispora]
MNKELADLLKIEKQKAIQLRYSKVEYAEKMISSIEQEENLLRDYQKLQKKYSALSESKLGNLTLRYWSWRKKLGGGKFEKRAK